MCDVSRPKVAIIDYGLGNLFSVKHACLWAGIDAEFTSVRGDIAAADGVILPGVGAFGDAMTALRRLDLIGPLQEAASSSKSLVGICLGMQLLMSESFEFGQHAGLGIIEGKVLLLDKPMDERGRMLKVPHVGWNGILNSGVNSDNDLWRHSLLDGIVDGEFMYFVHSFFVNLANSEIGLSKSWYGGIDFCSALEYKNIFACQFHPERSGMEGLKIYANLRKQIRNSKA